MDSFPHGWGCSFYAGCAMIVYVIATLLTCGIMFLYERHPDWRWLVIAAALPLIVVSGFRSGVGTDYNRTYVPQYHALELRHGTAKQPPSEDRAFVRLVKRGRFGRTPERVARHFDSTLNLNRCEPGYRALMEVSRWSGVGFRAVIVFCACVTVGCFFFSILRFSRWPTFAAFLFIAGGNYFMSMNVMRQFVAIAIGLVALEFVLARKPFHFLACVAVAFTMHFSAVLILPFYLLGRWELTPFRAVILIGVMFVMAFIVSTFGVDVLKAIGAKHYAHYFTSRHRKIEFEWIYFGIDLCYLVMGAWYWTRAKAESRLFTVLYGLTAIAAATIVMSITVPQMKRVHHYFSATQFLLLPEMLLVERNLKVRRILMVLVILLFSVETFVAVGLLNKNGVLPYRFSLGGA